MFVIIKHADTYSSSPVSHCKIIDMTNEQIKANLREAYNRQAEARNQGGFDTWKFEERARFLSMLQQENKRTMLEIGAGHGRDSVFFQEQAFKVTAIDLSPAMIGLCRQKGITALIMDMVDLGFTNETFDAAYALNTFLHLSKSEFPIAAKGVRRVLRPEGLFYLGLYGGYEFEGVWQDDSYDPKRFFSFHSDENLKNILANSFEIVYFRSIRLGEDNITFQSVILRKQAS